MRSGYALPSRRSFLAIGAALLALGLCVLVAWWAALAVENRTVAAVKSRLLGEGFTWASVTADGLEIHMAGTAPTEAARFRAINLAGSVVDAGRIRDGFEVTALRAIEAPRFSVEVLRNTDGVSLIGLVPAEGAGAELAAEVAELAGGLPVADMLETADYPAPQGWQTALDFGMEALRRLPRAKISIAADGVSVTAISDSVDEKKRLETELVRLAPEALKVAIDISAPRPVLTPFTLRFVKDAGGARFDACAADTDRARERILQAGTAAGAAGKIACTVGLGVPSPSWSEAASLAIASVDAMGEGTVTFSDTDVTLLAGPDVAQAVFDRVVGDLQARLPKVFSLTATLPPRSAEAPKGPAEFTAALSAEGRVELRGRLTDDLQKTAVDSLARAFFGADAVYTATRPDPDLPDGWPLRVLAGIEALSALDEGSLLVRADLVEVTGISGRQDASARISQVLSDKLGQGQTFKVDVRYDEARDPEAALPTPEECVADLNAVLARQKITFTPGSAEIDAAARVVIDALAAVLKDCPGLAMEIAGHTDSQGSESGNLALSQARAESVLVALQGRRLPVEAFSARGHGEAVPIADNASEDGREANRRIEFILTGATLASAPGAGPDAPLSQAVRPDGSSEPTDRPDAEGGTAEGDATAVPGPASVVILPAPQPAPQPASGADRGEGTRTLSASNAPPGASVTVAAAGADPMEVAGLEDPVNGLTRSITIPAEDAAAGPPADSGPQTHRFVPVEDGSIRPLRRPAP